MAHKKQWGNWVYDSRHRCLEHKPTEYPIALGTTNLAVQVFDWIRQIYGKTWADQSDLGNLLRAFHEVFSSSSIFKTAFDLEIMTRREHWIAFYNGVRLLIWDKTLDRQGWNQRLEKLYMDFKDSQFSDAP